MNKHVELLRLYNQWRRGDIEHLDFTAQEIGEAIDAVLEQHADLLTTVEKLRERINTHHDDIAALCIADDAMSRCKGEQGCQ